MFLSWGCNSVPSSTNAEILWASCEILWLVMEDVSRLRRLTFGGTGGASTLSRTGPAHLFSTSLILKTLFLLIFNVRCNEIPYINMYSSSICMRRSFNPHFWFTCGHAIFLSLRNKNGFIINFHFSCINKKKKKIIGQDSSKTLRII